MADQIQSEAPPRFGWQKLCYYDASGNLEYLCFAPVSAIASASVAVAATLTNIVVSANVGTANTVAAHGLTPGSKVVLSGWTVDVQLNGTYEVKTVPTSTSFTITTVDVTGAPTTYTDATGAATFTSIPDTAACWAIQKFWYDTGNKMVKSGWAEGTTTPSLIAASRATYTYR